MSFEAEHEISREREADAPMVERLSDARRDELLIRLDKVCVMDEEILASADFSTVCRVGAEAQVKRATHGLPGPCTCRAASS